MHLALTPEQWRKEPEALDVVHVQMRQQDVDAILLGRNDHAEATHARSRVKREETPFDAADLHRRRVAAVADRVGP